MRTVHFADDLQKKEISFNNLNVESIYTNNLEEFISTKADAYFHWHFENAPEIIAKLKDLQGVVVINSVPDTLKEIGLKNNFIRINGWPGFANNPIKEIAAANEGTAIQLFEAMGWQFKVVPDVVGFVTPRVIAMIINEAYFTLEADVSTKEEIDIAMKLGTNYPFGPFEWADKIGLKKIYQLLAKLSSDSKRYKPCDLLIKEAAY